MRNSYKRLFLFFSILCFYFSSNATHIVGGELYYRWLGNYNYEITLVVYRDCYNGVPPFDPIGCVGIFDINNNFIANLTFPVDPDSLRLPPAILAPCFIPPIDVCYEKAFYKDTINLPNIAGGYQLAYQRCCRNNSINNIQQPGATGITIYATIPGDPSLAVNSNPVFDTIAPASPDSSTLPPSFACLGVQFEFDNSAIDADGDSLVYELCNPYEGLSQANPGPTCPDPPPYGNVIFQAPFSLANLLGGVPPMAINSQTGLLTATPNTIGQFVMAICVSEYRNGIFVSKSRRDYQLNVVSCPSLIVAALQTPLIHCGDSTVTFLNQSVNASTYDWNFGDPTTLSDTSHLTNPSYSYPDTGTYTVTLIAHSTLGPTCVDTAVGTVHIYPPFIADFSFVDSLCSYKFFFTDTSTNNGSGITTAWSWNFSNAPTSNIHNPSHNYPGPGTYNVTLIATSDRGCKDTVVKPVFVDTLVNTAFVINQPVACNGDCNGTATAVPYAGTPPYTYQWNTPNNDTTPTAVNLCAGTYSVTITDSNGCTITKNVTLSNPAVLTSTSSSTDAYCEGKCIGTAAVHPSGGTPPYTYSWNPNGETSQSINNLCQGDYFVLVTDAHGCTGADTMHVGYSNYVPPVNATVSADTIYEGQSVQYNSTLYLNTAYSWSPPNNLSDPGIYNPSGTYLAEGTYAYEVTIIDSLGCENKDSVRLVVRNVMCIEPEIFIPNAFTPDNNGTNDLLYVRGNTIRELLLRIYDRWGEKVYETNSPGTGWNGIYKGKPVQPGVYDYYLEATCYNNEKFFKKGNVTVIK